MSLETGHMYELKYVLAQLCKQHPTEVVTAALLHPSDFVELLERSHTEFRQLLAANRDDWSGRFQRTPCSVIGIQVRNMNIIQ